MLILLLRSMNRPSQLCCDIHRYSSLYIVHRSETHYYTHKIHAIIIDLFRFLFRMLKLKCFLLLRFVGFVWNNNVKYPFSHPLVKGRHTEKFHIVDSCGNKTCSISVRLCFDRWSVWFPFVCFDRWSVWFYITYGPHLEYCTQRSATGASVSSFDSVSSVSANIPNLWWQKCRFNAGKSVKLVMIKMSILWE